MPGLLDLDELHPMQLLGMGLMGGTSPHFGQNLMQAMTYAQGHKRARMNDEQIKLQMAEQRRAMAEREKIQRAWDESVMPAQNLNPVQMDDEGNQLPPSMSAPQVDFGGLRNRLIAAGPQGFQMAAQLAPKNESPFAKIDPKDYTPESVRNFTLTKNPADLVPYRKPEKPDLDSLVIMGPDGKPMINQLAVDARAKVQAAGRPQVTTNVIPPNKTFETSLQFKKDFDDQPEVKGFKEVRHAWDQIRTALARPSAANDLAAATKFMKMLDPGSVVRESELMMAMQASGAFDRFANLANRVLTGEKLTPQQRQDFYKSGEALFNAAESRYGQTKQQYQELAQRYGLDVDFFGSGKSGWRIVE